MGLKKKSSKPEVGQREGQSEGGKEIEWGERGRGTQRGRGEDFDHLSLSLEWRSCKHRMELLI
jgi:hypothetical protein